MIGGLRKLASELWSKKCEDEMARDQNVPLRNLSRNLFEILYSFISDDKFSSPTLDPLI